MATAFFKDLSLSEWICNQCKYLGMQTPTPVQMNCIPPILKGCDVLGCAKTGSGKTAAFALPILQKLCEDPYGIFALIITPTRELARQISEQFEVLGKPIRTRVQVVTGGMDSVIQSAELDSQPHILVSTPGRLADQIDTHDSLSLRRVRFVVLDEADRLLEDDFGAQLKIIFDCLPKKRQTLLFSATLTDTLRKLQAVSKNNPFTWVADLSKATVEELDERYVLMPADVKDAYLMHILDTFRDEKPNSLVLIFAQTCKYVQILALMCESLGFSCVTLHSVMKQKHRVIALNKFKSHQIKLLIATDVASRGLDIPTVDLIINHNVPLRPKDYVHRVGRTARAGRAGMAITLVTQFDIKLVHAVEALTKRKMTEHPTSEAEVLKIATEVAVARREAEIIIDSRDFDQQKIINRRKREILRKEGLYDGTFRKRRLEKEGDESERARDDNDSDENEEKMMQKKYANSSSKSTLTSDKYISKNKVQNNNDKSNHNIKVSKKNKKKQKKK